MKYTIKQDTIFGRGLYATQDISRGETITKCEILVLSEQDTKNVNETELKYYTFVYNENQDCLVLGDGEIFNHSDDQNCEYFFVIKKDSSTGLKRQVMSFSAIKSIKAGEQLFINYNQDTQVNPFDYIKNKSLI